MKIIEQFTNVHNYKLETILDGLKHKALYLGFLVLPRQLI